MTDMSLTNDMAAVIANLKSRRWTRFWTVRGESVNAHGAVLTCQGLRPGNGSIILAVMRARGVTEEWNREEGRTKAEALAALRKIECSDKDLEFTFGSQWRRVVALVQRIAALTPDEMEKLGDVGQGTAGFEQSIAEEASRKAAKDAVRKAAEAAEAVARKAAKDAARKAAKDAARKAVRTSNSNAGKSRTLSDTLTSAEETAATAVLTSDASYMFRTMGVMRCQRWVAVDAVESAAWSIVAADLVGKHGLTQDHIDLLIAPWTAAVGEAWDTSASSEESDNV